MKLLFSFFLFAVLILSFGSKSLAQAAVEEAKALVKKYNQKNIQKYTEPGDSGTDNPGMSSSEADIAQYDAAVSYSDSKLSARSQVDRFNKSHADRVRAILGSQEEPSKTANENENAQ